MDGSRSNRKRIRGVLSQFCYTHLQVFLVSADARTVCTSLDSFQLYAGGHLDMHIDSVQEVGLICSVK